MGVVIIALAAGGSAALAADAPRAASPADQPGLKTEHFDRDPGWEGHNNRIVSQNRPKVRQDFGFSAESNFAGKAKGELGGWVTRAAEPAFYADKIGPRSLDDPLHAAGTFSVKTTSPSGGVFFGFFRAEQVGFSGRPTSSLGLDLNFERGGGQLAVRLITGNNQSCGTFITPFVPGKFRPTPIAVGTRYTWTLDYDPKAANGRGQFKFTFTGDTPKPGEYIKPEIAEAFQKEARIRFPETTAFTVDLPEGYKQQKTVFDHFGLMNMMKPGGTVQIYFDDLAYEGKTQDFSSDPKWDASGNRISYESKEAAGAHNFGYSADTHFAGEKAGEIGGVFWRSGVYAYYADRVGPLSLQDRLEARGKVVLQSGAPDSDMFMGWFNSKEKEKPPTVAGNFVGVHIGGPTRVGHYFQPSFCTAKGTPMQAKDGPVLVPGQVYDWSLIYDPAAAGGNGAITVTLASKTVTLELKRGLKAEGAALDRFGFFTPSVGGQIVRLYVDDVSYTSGRSSP